MIFSTITQNKLTVTADTTEIPAQYSNNIQFEFVQDTENYSGYTPTVYATLYDSSLIECADILNAGGNVAIENGIFTIGNQILYQSGYLAVGITLTNGDENVALPPVIYKVLASVGGLSPLPPDEGEWQQVVDAYVNTLFETWSTENLTPIQNQLESLVSQAQQLQQTASNQQTQINNAISIMGDYQIVSEDPVQIQFKKGNGDFGPTVDLGDGLASKSMVNGKYYQSAAEMYSGAASNYGIQVQQIMGAYKQDGTPTPDNPVEPQFNVINGFYTSGENLLDFDYLKNNNVSKETKTYTDNSITLTSTDNDCYDISYTVNQDFRIPVIPNHNYSLLFNSSIISVGYTYVFYYDKEKQYISNDAYNTNSYNMAINFTTPKNCYYIAFRNGIQNSGQTCTFSDFMILQGTHTWDDITQFIPFVGSSTTPVSLELRALPDGTADVWEDGVTTQNVAKVTFDGSSDENWTIYSGVSKETYTFKIDILNKPTGYNNAFCNKLKYLNACWEKNDEFCCSTFSIGRGFYVNTNTTISTVEQFKTWLSQNPIDVYYALETPTTEPLAIPTLTSYYPFTNAWCDSQVPGMITWNVLTGNVKPDELDPAIQEYINNNVPGMITNAINSALASYCPFAVGDIYITSLSANPNTKYPGTTWQAISGETLVGYLEDDPDFGTLGASVGEATHTLTVDEIPSHNHSITNTLSSCQQLNGEWGTYLIAGNNNSFVQNTGGGQAHNNIQPSRVVMIWQRTA